MTSVSVVVPSIGTRGTARGGDRVFVVEAVRSVLATVGQRFDLETIVVSGREMPADVEHELVALGGADESVRCVDYDAPFNFSATINLGAAHARGDFLLLLNDDTEVVNPDWLDLMVDAAASPDVGAVGARLLFEDGTLQHAGHTYRTSLDHIAFGRPGDTTGRTGILARRREVAGVTAACMLTPAGVFEAVGGMCTHLPGNYNDVDYCLKLRLAGWSVVYEPAAVLYHFESRSRTEGGGVGADEVDFIRGRWATRLAGDEFTPLVP